MTFELQVGDKQKDTQARKQTHTHINNMTRPGLGAGPSENNYVAIYALYFEEKWL